jgi:DNA adenine methylase
MQYFGGKQRIAKKLAEVIAPIARERGCYVEPFVGGAAVMAAIDAPVRIGSDVNAALITMWRALANGWQPPDTVSEEEYAMVKARNDHTDPFTAFVAIGCSFSGKWWGGYARNAIGHNYALSAVRSLKKKLTTLHGVDWRVSDYRKLEYPKNSVIYCDPPYQGTTGYAGAPGKFNWFEFWQFYRDKSFAGHAVFVSEYSAPDDFEACMLIATKTSIRMADGNVSPRIEKLFVHKSVEIKKDPAGSSA